MAMQHGHDPREIRDYAWRDLELMLTLEGAEASALAQLFDS